MSHTAYELRRGKLSNRERYRRTKELWYYKMLRINKEDAEPIKTMAKQKGISEAELIRTFITWGLENG